MNELHLHELAILSDQLGYPVNADELLQRFQKLASKKRHQLLVYEENGKVLGWIHLEAWKISSKKIKWKSRP